MVQKLTRTSLSNADERKFYQKELLELQAANKKLQERVAAIESSERRLAALNTISGLITQSVEIRDVLTLAANKIMEVMDADAITVFLLDDKTKELILELYEAGSNYLVSEKKRIKIGEGYHGRVAQTGEPMVIEDTTSEPPRGQAVANREIRAQVIVPLKSKGKVIGTLSATKRTQGKFDLDQLELLSSIGNHIGANLGNVRLYEGMKRTLNQLQQSEERYRDLFENNGDAIWMHDFDNQTLAANHACEKVTGYSLKRLMDMNVCQLLSHSGRAQVERIEASLLRDEPVDPRCEVELVMKGGATRIVDITLSLVAHEGEAIGFQYTARDVTDEREMQENLRYYLQQVTRAQEEERKRVARELHDETLQSLIVISRQLEKIISSDALWEESLEDVRDLKKRIETAVQEIRRFSHDLRPTVLDDLGLLPALELLADDLEKEGITTSFKVIGEVGRLVPEVEVMLFRIAQEAVRNIWRHAQASAAELVIEFRDARVSLSIRDNGKGCILSQRPRDLARLGKLGLAGMHERARLLGGSLTFESRPGKGTMITVEVPV